MFNIIANTLSWGVGAVLGSQAALRTTQHKQPRPLPHQFAALLDHPWRLRYRDPAATLGLYGCGAGLTVLDLGCGTGLFTVEMARMVEQDGLVHAVDLQAALLTKAQQRLATAGLSGRVRFHCCGAQQLPLADSSVDLAVVIATLPQIPERFLALTELSRVLKPGGRLAISEELPDPAYVPPAVMRRWVTAALFQFAGQSGSWFCYHQIYLNDK